MFNCPIKFIFCVKKNKKNSLIYFIFVRPIYVIKKTYFYHEPKITYYYVNIQYVSCKNMVQNGLTGNLIPGPTGIGPRNTPHLVQLNITWTGPRSNGPSDLVQ